MKKLFCVLSELILASICSAQDYPKEFHEHLIKKDTLKLREVLEKWDQDNPGDAEWFTACLNYYYLKSREEIATLTQEKPHGEYLALTDSLGQTAGYLGSRIAFDEGMLRKGVEKINEGIALYPDRLDMRFGKIYVLGQTENWREFKNEAIAAVRRSGINGNRWRWTNNEMLPDGKETFLSSLQDYQLLLYNTQDDRLLPLMREIASEILEIYPEHIESLSNIAITYLLTGEYEKGIEVLLRAEKIDPTDVVILNNIAYAYRSHRNTGKAAEYYRKVIRYGNAGEAEAAKEQIRQLK